MTDRQILVSDNKVIGEVSGVNSFADSRGQWIIIRSDDDSVFNELLDINKHLFFIVSKDNCIQISVINEYEWVESRDWWSNNLPGLSIKIKCVIIDENFTPENSHFGKIYKSYYRDLKLDSILE
jgi:hypothetical protein